MLFDLTAFILADRGQRQLFASALPDAPVVPGAPSARPPARRWLRLPRQLQANPVTPRLAG